MKDDRISNWFTTGTAVERPKEGTLFYEAVIEPLRDVEHAGNEVAPPAPRPNLTLVRDDDDDLEESILREHCEALDADVLTSSEGAAASPREADTDAWPWEDEVESSRGDRAEMDDGPVFQTASMKHAERAEAQTTSASPCREDDQSASEDVILCEPVGILTVEQAAGAEETAAEDEILTESDEAGSAYSLRTVNTPRRIGSGQLVPARLTWRPGDPFGGDVRGKTRFRWEVMLTSACVTAACGLGCIWLLRTLLA